MTTKIVVTLRNKVKLWRKRNRKFPVVLKRKCNGSFNNFCFDNLHIHISKYFKIGLLKPVEF